ncbi:hypothetical protein DXX10_20920 [Salmonella enterica]|nr:hypothetical protein [Salmonella enterica subsp. enterica serovar Heidelberg]EBO6923467.1 hypothetical protein [Salmonella enterica]
MRIRNGRNTHQQTDHYLKHINPLLPRLYHQDFTTKTLSELAAITLSQGIPVTFQVTCALALLSYPSHELMYVPGDSLPCRLDAT